jgi:arabinogalactan oligomer/maltooligosaccharide transport system substrate-binding protein
VPNSDFDTKLLTTIAGGSPPDVFISYSEQIVNLAGRGALISLDDALKDGAASIAPIALEGCTVEGKLFCAPQLLTLPALFYNTDLMPKPPVTTDELLAAVRSGVTVGIIQQPYYNYGFFAGFGGRLLDDNGICVADQSGFADAMRYLLELKAGGAKFYGDYSSAHEAFKNGQIAMLINSSWEIAGYRAALGDKLAVAPLPAGPHGPSRQLVNTVGFAVPTGSQNPQGAIALALYLSHPFAQQIEVDAGGAVPADTSVEISDPLIRSFADIATSGVPIQMRKEFGAWWTPFDDMFTSVLEHGADPQEAVANACKSMNDANTEQK